MAKIELGPWWKDILDREKGKKNPEQPHAPSPEPPHSLPDDDPEPVTEKIPDRGSVIIDDTIDDPDDTTEIIE
jgi:hypothetical protein